MKKLCIYHHGCTDGFAAAWVVRRALGDDVEFFPGVYQTPPPDVTGRHVIIVDFSYKRPVLLEMARRAKSILILDHHKSAAGELVLLPENVTAIFDMTHSGAMLAWRHFFPGDPPPELLDHIQDRDLWRFWLQGTREIHAAVASYPYHFATWDMLMSTDIDQLYMEGESIERKHHKDLADFIQIAAHRMTIAGFHVPVLNAPYFWASDAGHLLAQGEPFAACYYDVPDGRVFSLRSTEGGCDVSEIARLFGGGGHRHAAGFKVSMTHDIARRPARAEDDGSKSQARPRAEMQIDRACRIASTAAEEILRSECIANELGEFVVPQCDVDDHMRECIAHLCWRGEAVSLETDDGYIVVKMCDDII